MIPRVSVVIPTYNNAALLHETLDGVRRQTFRDLEVIVVDDGSTDETAEAVSRYDSSIRYVRQTNQGPAAARNTGAELARGEFLAFCDHDDIWKEKHLERLVDCFVTYPLAAMCFDNAEVLGGIAHGEIHVDKKVLPSMIGRKVPIIRLWHCWVASMSVVMVRRAVFVKLGGLHPDIWGLDDLHFYLRLGVEYEVRYVDYIGCQKRSGSTNLLRQTALSGLIQCLQDIKNNHPRVVHAIGPWKLRRRLARCYRKLGERHRESGQSELAREMYWRAYRENRLNLGDLCAYLFRV
jgi:glycosyltransferase involved in cell wall biosynthesis